MTKAKPLTPEKAYKMIMECYQSGLTTSQWLLKNGINQATFYKWVKKLRDNACYNIPPANPVRRISTVPMKQEVVQVNVIPDNRPADVAVNHEIEPPISCAQNNLCPVIIQIAGASILVNDNADERLLKSVIRSVREALC
jgi:transposase-like protein